MNNLRIRISSILKNSNVLWNMIGITINSFYSLILIILITRLNGIEVSGQFSFVFYMTSTFQQIGNYGGRIYQVSDTTEQYSSGDYVSSRYLTSITMTVVTLGFCIINGYDFFKVSLFMVLILYRFLDAISESYYAILQKNGKLSLVGKSMTIKVLGAMILFLIIDVFTKNIVFASSSFIISYFITMVIYDRKNAKEFGEVKIGLNNKIIHLLVESFQVFLFSFLNIMMLNVTRYFVDINLTDTIQGYYSIMIMPASIIALFAQFLVQPMVKSLVDSFNSGKIKVFRKNCTMILAVIIIFGCLAALISYFIMPFLLNLVYGIDFSIYNLEISLIVLAGIFSGATTVISTILIIMRKLSSQLYGFIFSVFACACVSFFMVHDSIYEAIYAYLFAMLIEFIIFLFLFSKHLFLETNSKEENSEGGSV